MSPRPAFDALQISALDNTATLLKSVRISDEVVVGGQTDVLRIKPASRQKITQSPETK